MIDPQQNSSRPFMSITPRKKSVRFNITTPSPRVPSLLPQHEPNHRQHPLNVSYTIPSTTVNIDHVTNQPHMKHMNNRSQYVPTTRRNNLQVNGEKIHAPSTTLDELHQFMKKKAENLRQNMIKVTDTFNHASANLTRLKDEKETISRRPSRIPVSIRHRSPSPPIVIYRKPQHRSLDDLRWYYLARKYSILWQKSVFGCHLRRVKLIYKKNLVRKYFHFWRNTTNADKCELIAIEHDRKRLLRQYFHIWYHIMTLNNLAIEYIERKRTEKAWNFWKIQFNKRRLHQSQYHLAIQQYNRTVLFHFYNFWRTNTSEKRQMNDKQIRAYYFFRIHVQRKCFNAWLNYAEYRRRKNNHKKRVHEYYQRRLITRIYSSWKQELTNKLIMQQHQYRLEQLNEKILLRWAFERWKTYMNDLVDEQRTLQMAGEYSDRRIMRSAFVKLFQYMQKRRIKQRLNWIAVEHQAKTIKSIYYLIWKNRLEQRENIFMLAEFRKADSFYHMKITIRYWFLWRRYINDCRQENARLKAAENYHNSKLLRKYFHLLRANLTEERHVELLEKRADEHYRLRYLQIYYEFWKVETQINQQNQMNWRIAIVHDENSTRRRIFNTWLNRAHSRLIDNEQHVVAERHYFRTILTRAWSSWRQIIEEHHNEDRLEQIATEFYYHSIQRRCLNAWKMYICHCRRMKQMYCESEQFYLHHRGRNIMFEWLTKARQRRRLMSIVNEHCQRKQRLVLRQYFRQWRDNVEEEKNDRQLNQYAYDHYNRSLKRKILLAWNNQMIQQVLIDNENEMKLNKYRERKNYNLQQMMYNKWKQMTNEYARQNFLNQRSQMYYGKNLLKKYFYIWKQQHHDEMRIKLLERQAIWFDRMRLMSRVYTKWKQSWASEMKLNEQKHRALIFWALQLQKRYFLQWLIYVSERKRKKARYNQATHLRHDELVRNSLRQFLIYTDHAKTRRQALFIHQQVYLYHDRNALASKYLSKWREYVNKSISRKQNTKISIKRTTNTVPINNRPLDLIKFDNSPPKITNRPKPRKPAFLSESFTTATIANEIPLIHMETPTSSASPQIIPKIDHSVHSPFITVRQPIVNRQDSPPLLPQTTLLLPPSAFKIEETDIKMPLSSRRISDNKISMPHRPYSTQPSARILTDKHNLLDVKQRLEIYLENKEKLKRLRQQLANLPSSQIDTKLEHEFQQLSAFIASEKVQLTNVLQNL